MVLTQGRNYAQLQPKWDRCCPGPTLNWAVKSCWGEITILFCRCGHWFVLMLQCMTHAHTCMDNTIYSKKKALSLEELCLGRQRESWRRNRDHISLYTCMKFSKNKIEGGACAYGVQEWNAVLRMWNVLDRLMCLKTLYGKVIKALRGWTFCRKWVTGGGSRDFHFLLTPCFPT